MYALAFDMVISDLQKYYGEPYNKAYYEIKELLKKNGFEWVQGSTYMTTNDDLTALVKTVMELSKIEWFKKSVRDLRGLKVESWSNLFFYFLLILFKYFSLKLWKLRGKVVSLPINSSKKEIMGHQEDIVKTESKIIVIRDTQVILDRDVAELYGVETREINQALRNMLLS